VSKIRVLIADDHPVVRAGLRTLLSAEDDMEVVGEAADGGDALINTLNLAPDIVVMDLAMPDVTGLEALERIVKSGLQTRVLVLTIHDDEQYFYRAIRAGASGYVVKSSADRDLLGAIRMAHAGGVFLYASAETGILRDYAERTDLVRGGHTAHELTDREVEVLKLTAEGFSNQEIAKKLSLSHKTVDTYRSRIMDKLHLRHRSELIQYALRRGLLEPNP
jgi:two-component system, NarL family, response regulator NreC